MIRIGLTGGIGAGKSVAARHFAELGAVVIDHDQLARDVVEPGTVGLERIEEEFGVDVLTADGSLDRAALGHLVFGNRDALDRLNAIVHPEVRRLAAQRQAAAEALDERAVIVHDIPLLVETGQGQDFHLLVVVHAPADLRITRLVERRGMTLPEARRRVASQASDTERLEAADVVLDGAGAEASLREQLDGLWVRLQEEAAAQV